MATQRRNGLYAAGLALVTSAVLVTTASAQNVDRRLLPWVGCWEPVSAEAPGGMLCVRPSPQEGAIDVVRLAGNEIVSRELVWADGTRHETVREGCTGWETGSFSKDGRRVFLKSEHSCDGGDSQGGAGIMAISPGENQWIDVRVVGMNGEQTAWVQRYTLASADKTEAAGFGDVIQRTWTAGAARVAASAPLDVDDVIEASAMVPSEAVEALLAERGDPLDLNADKLVRMADAGVASSTIDVAVAVSFPGTFQVAATGGVERDVTRAGLGAGDVPGRWGYRGAMGGMFYNPYYYDSFYNSGAFGYGGYGYGYGSYYGGYGYQPTVVIVNPKQDDASHGRMVKGRGYTRGGGGSGSAPQGYAPSRQSSPSGSSSGSGTAGSSSAGSSSGSSTPRKAKPRGSGGH